MGLWDKSLRIFNGLCDNGQQSLRHIAHHTGFSKSSVHRHKQAMERRGVHPESWWWETAEGRQWFTRLFVATLYPFGLKRGVGVPTRSEFCARLHLETQRGCAPSAVRRVMQALEAALLETAEGWEQDGLAEGEVREIIGAVEETFLAQMMLVFREVKTGYLLREEVAEERTDARWKTVVEERLTALRTDGRYVVSDRAKALIQLADQGLGGLRMPDVFQVMHDLVQSSSLAIARQVRRAHHALKHAAERLRRHPNADGPLQAPLVEPRRVDVQHWEGVRSTYRHHLAVLSLTVHPFHLDDAIPPTSAQVHSRLDAEVSALETFAQTQQIPAQPTRMKKGQKPLPALAALVDFWWEGVEHDLAQASLSPPWRQWARTVLLPCVYWGHHSTHTRCPRRKAAMQSVWEAAHAALHRHALTQPLPPQALEAWHAWATQQVLALRRTSSAVEGRNGALAPLHHHQRGLPEQRYKVWTVLHTFDCRAPDGTTPAARFFGRTFPDLFETVVSHIEALPQPRRRQGQVALGH